MGPSFGGRLEMLKRGASGIGTIIGADVTTTGGTGTVAVGTTIGSVITAIAAAPATPFILGGAAVIGAAYAVKKLAED